MFNSAVSLKTLFCYKMPFFPADPWPSPSRWLHTVTFLMDFLFNLDYSKITNPSSHQAKGLLSTQKTPDLLVCVWLFFPAKPLRLKWFLQLLEFTVFQSKTQLGCAPGLPRCRRFVPLIVSFFGSLWAKQGFFFFSSLLWMSPVCSLGEEPWPHRLCIARVFNHFLP